MPYGFERDHWDRVLSKLAALRDSLEEDAPEDDDIVAERALGARRVGADHLSTRGL